MIMNWVYTPSEGLGTKFRTIFATLKILKFNIGQIKMLFCSVAKVEPLV